MFTWDIIIETAHWLCTFVVVGELGFVVYAWHWLKNNDN